MDSNWLMVYFKLPEEMIRIIGNLRDIFFLSITNFPRSCSWHAFLDLCNWVAGGLERNFPLFLFLNHPSQPLQSLGS